MPAIVGYCPLDSNVSGCTVKYLSSLTSKIHLRQKAETLKIAQINVETAISLREEVPSRCGKEIQHLGHGFGVVKEGVFGSTQAEGKHRVEDNLWKRASGYSALVWSP